MTIRKTGQQITLEYIAPSGDTGLDVRATARNEAGTEIFSDFALTHEENGIYRDESKTMTSDDELHIDYIAYDTFSSDRSEVDGPADEKFTNAAFLDLDELDNIVADTNEIQGKLPTNNIMGSSDTDDHDTDIDAILVDTNSLNDTKVPGVVETKSEADTRQTALIAEHDATQADIAALNDLDATAVAAAVWDALLSSHTTASTMGANMNLVDDIESDTASLNDTKVPGVVEQKTEADARQVILVAEHDATQAALAALNDLAIADVQTALTNQGYTAARAVFLDNLDATISSIASDIAALNDLDATAVENAVWDTVLSGHLTAGSTGKALSDAGAGGVPPTVPDIVAGVWDELKSAHTTPNSFGDFLDIEVSSRQSETSAASRASTNQTEHDATQSAIAALNNLSSSQVAQAVWDAALSSHLTAGTMGANQNLIDDIDGNVDQVITDISNLNDIDTTDVQSAMTSQGYTSARAILLDNLSNLDATISSVSTLIGALNDLSIADVQTAMTNQGYTSVRAALLDQLSFLDSSVLGVATAIGALNDLDATEVENAVWDTVLGGHLTIGTTGKALSDILGSTAPTPESIADAVWDELLSGHTTPGSAGVALSGITTLTDLLAGQGCELIGLVGDDAILGLVEEQGTVFGLIECQ